MIDINWLVILSIFSQVNLLTLVKMRPSVLHLGYKGAMLLARFLSIPAGLKFLTDANYVEHELQKWHKVSCYNVLQIIILNNPLTLRLVRTFDALLNFYLELQSKIRGNSRREVE